MRYRRRYDPFYSHRDEIAAEHMRRRSSAAHRDEHFKPATLLSLDRHDHSTELMLRAFADGYIEAIAMGRIEQWRKAAISCIDLMADFAPRVQQHPAAQRRS